MSQFVVPQQGIVETVWPAGTALGTLTSPFIYSLPGKDVEQAQGGSLTWQGIVLGTPASISILLEGSMDNVNWVTVDSSTNVAGEARTVSPMPNFRYFRFRISAVSGGTTFTLFFAI